MQRPLTLHSLNSIGNNIRPDLRDLIRKPQNRRQIRLILLRNLYAVLELIVINDEHRINGFRDLHIFGFFLNTLTRIGFECKNDFLRFTHSQLDIIGIEAELTDMASHINDKAGFGVFEKWKEGFYIIKDTDFHEILGDSAGIGYTVLL
jgi:hypothetical protein